MKQIKFLLFALFAAGAVACQSSDLDDAIPNGGSTGSNGSEKIIFTAGVPMPDGVDVDTAASDTRMGVAGAGAAEEAISYTWHNSDTEGVDTFALYDGDERIGTFKYVGEHGAASGEFEPVGELTKELVDGEQYIAIMPESYPFSSYIGDDNQTIRWDDISTLDGNIVFKGGVDYKEGGSNAFSFTTMCSIIKLNLTTQDGFVPKSMKVINSDKDDESYNITIEGDGGRSLYFAIKNGDTALQFDLYDAEGNLGQVIGYSITDKMKPTPLTMNKWYDVTRESYYDYYRSGAEIDGVRYDESNSDITMVTGNIYNSAHNSKVVFLDPSATDTQYSLSSINDIVLIGRYSNNKPSIDVTGSILLSQSSKINLKNIDISFSGSGGYIFGASAVASSLVVEDCNIAVPAGKPIVYLAAGKAINNIAFSSNKIETSSAKELLGLGSGDGANINSISLQNNIVCSTTGTDIKYYILSMPATANVNRVVDIKRNTFYSYLGLHSGNAFVYGNLGALSISRNIFYGVDNTQGSGLLKSGSATTSQDIDDNKYYSKVAQRFYDYAWVSGLSRKEYTKETTDPLTYETDGLFTSKIAGYGSKIE